MDIFGNLGLTGQIGYTSFDGSALQELNLNNPQCKLGVDGCLHGYSSEGAE